VDTPYPISVDLIRADNVLEIRWQDGATTRHSGEQLRWACPCAECRGEAGQLGRLDRTQTLGSPELVLAEVGLIGQYALMITFQSGHGTGIYTFPRLRDLASS